MNRVFEQKSNTDSNNRVEFVEQKTDLSTILEETSYFPSDFSTLITAPFRLQLKETSGAPFALQVKTPVLPLSEADLAIDGEVSILGLSAEKVILKVKIRRD